jgi:NAD(P)-dependent dehydrogenase (short-subunit alcohol dehydrogenase family)
MWLAYPCGRDETNSIIKYHHHQIKLSHSSAVSESAANVQDVDYKASREKLPWWLAVHPELDWQLLKHFCLTGICRWLQPAKHFKFCHCFGWKFDAKKFAFVEGDATDEESVKGFVNEGVARFGGLDIAILNAGVIPRQKPLLEFGSTDYEHCMRVNFYGRMYLLFSHWAYSKW